MYEKKVSGRVTSIFPRDVNTDYIIPAPLLQQIWSKKELAKHAFEKYDRGFVRRCSKNTDNLNVVLAGPNFGCGSSREQAVYALQYNRVAFVVAQKDPSTGTAYPDIFYRNAVNNGFAVIAIDDISDISANDILELDLSGRVVYNKTKGKQYKFEMPEEHIQTLIEGGLLSRARKDLETRLKQQYSTHLR